MYYILCNTFYHKKKIKAILLSDVNRFYLKNDAFILGSTQVALDNEIASEIIAIRASN